MGSFYTEKPSFQTCVIQTFSLILCPERLCSGCLNCSYYTLLFSPCILFGNYSVPCVHARVYVISLITSSIMKLITMTLN